MNLTGKMLIQIGHDQKWHIYHSENRAVCGVGWRGRIEGNFLMKAHHEPDFEVICRRCLKELEKVK